MSSINDEMHLRFIVPIDAVGFRKIQLILISFNNYFVSWNNAASYFKSQFLRGLLQFFY